jgi:ABC-type transporter Mla maintaining outer membrane lipid asymmetry permease subunit MlaE
VISYHQGSRPKGSASDVSDSITSTVLWATLFVLVVHFFVALQEF